MYKIKFDGWSWEGDEDGVERDLAGYNCWDYFYAAVPDSFATREEAQQWLDDHHRGKDVDGVDAMFSVVAAE